MKNKCRFVLSFCFLFSFYSFYAQEIKIFKVKDFDLKGKVATCNVLAKYGKEEYNFNTSGFLTKSLTRYSDTDYDISYYKYSSNFIIEKRVENYRNNTLDVQTSLAHLYEIDSSDQLKITEKIISYGKEFIDLYEYQFDNQNRVVKVLRRNNEGDDESTIAFEEAYEISKEIFKTNGVITKERIVSFEKINDSLTDKIITTTSFLEGNFNKRNTMRYNNVGSLILENVFFYDESKKEFLENTAVLYSYDENDVLAQKKITRNGAQEISDYIYQFDPQGNWVKEIISPDNTYSTREINYYPSEEMPEENKD